MAIITVQCRLQAEEKTLKYLWELGTTQNTTFVSEILEQIATHPDIQSWLLEGYIPTTAIDKIASELKKQERYKSMAARPTTSATTLVKETYKSWFAIQGNKRRRLWGKKRWLLIIKSESELLEAANLSLPELQAEAEKIFKKEQKKQQKLAQENPEAERTQDLFFHFMDIYDKTSKNYEKEKKPHLKEKKLIRQCAIAYLLKNKLQFTNRPEDPEKYQLYRRKKEIEVKKLESQLKARLPRGRSLEKDKYLKALEQANRFFYVDRFSCNFLIWQLCRTPKVKKFIVMMYFMYLLDRCGIETEDAESLQAILLRSEKTVPLPISYNTNTDIRWFKNGVAQ